MAKSCQIIALFLMAFFLTQPLQAIELRFPVACTIMTNCWVTDHVDLKGNSNDKQDYMCGKKVTNDNKSTHISLNSLDAAGLNVPVMASSSGTVTYAGATGGSCGNLVKIEHDKGWETTYCHLKDNIFVRKGQPVKRGQFIGVVGMSGQTQWPHLSFAVMRNGLIFDPFSGRSNLDGCAGIHVSEQKDSLWLNGKNPPYEPAHVTNIGFTTYYPRNQDILSGKMKSVQTIPSYSKRVALWGLIMNAQDGDEVTLRIYDPDGDVLTESIFNADRAQEYYPLFLNKERNNLLWKYGVYTGEITIERNVGGKIFKTGKTIKTVIPDQN